MGKVVAFRSPVECRDYIKRKEPAQIIIMPVVRIERAEDVHEFARCKYRPDGCDDPTSCQHFLACIHKAMDNLGLRKC